MRRRKYTLAVVVVAMLFLQACLVVIAHNSKETIEGEERDVLIYADVEIVDAGSYWHDVVTQPSCGSVSSAVVDGALAFWFDRSSGVARGTYKFKYFVRGVSKAWGLDLTSEAEVEVHFTETIPAPDGSPPCGAQYQAFLDSASDSGSGAARSVSVSWHVPEDSEPADSYKITVTDTKTGAALGEATFGAPQGNAIQTANISHSQALRLKITLETILNNQVMYTDTLVIQGAPLDFIAVDDYVTVDRNRGGSDPVNVLANDYDLSGQPLTDAIVTVVDSAGLILHKFLTQTQEMAFVVIINQETEAGQHRITLSVQKAGYNSQTEYLYVDVIGDDFVVVDDYVMLERGVNERAIVDVLANDYIPITTAEGILKEPLTNPRLDVVDNAGLFLWKVSQSGGNEAIRVHMYPETDAGAHTVLLRVTHPQYNPQYERLTVEIKGPDFVAVDDYAQMVKGVTAKVVLNLGANDYLPDKAQTSTPLEIVGARIVDDGGLMFHKILDERGLEGYALVDSGLPPGQYTAVFKILARGHNPQYSKLVVDVVDALEANDDTLAGQAGLNVNLPVLNNDTTYDGGPLTIIGFSQPGGAIVASSGSSLSIFGPAGKYVFGYTIQDQHGNQASANVSVTLVEPPPPNPCEVNPFNPNC